LVLFLFNSVIGIPAAQALSPVATFILVPARRNGKVATRLFRLERGESYFLFVKYIAFGEGDTAPVTHEVLRKAEKDSNRRPIVHVGG
jgi:hypothetical protein